METPLTTPKKLTELVGAIVDDYLADPTIGHLDSPFLPNRNRAIQIVELLRRVFFPGFFDEQRLTSDTVHFHVGELLHQIYGHLYDQVCQALRYDLNHSQQSITDEQSGQCDGRAHQITFEFLSCIPDLRRKLSLDVQASFDGDPAAENRDETIFCYPGIDAIFIHRVAHQLSLLGVPLVPRIISEYAHNQTGIDIHPDAKIGKSFFLDHGTGVVIGETTQIGDRVKIYQGVTLGALSTKGGQAWRGRKRHPTIQDDVTIYGGAIILGGNTVIGKGATIGGSVFLTQSVPPEHTVSMKLSELKVTGPRQRKTKAKGSSGQDTPPFNTPASTP